MSRPRPLGTGSSIHTPWVLRLGGSRKGTPQVLLRTNREGWQKCFPSLGGPASTPRLYFVALTRPLRAHKCVPFSLQRAPGRRRSSQAPSPTSGLPAASWGAGPVLSGTGCGNSTGWVAGEQRSASSILSLRQPHASPWASHSASRTRPSPIKRGRCTRRP